MSVRLGRPISAVTLSDRDKQLLNGLLHGSINKHIAMIVGYKSEQVVKNRFRRLYDTIGVTNRLEACLWWMKENPQAEHFSSYFPVKVLGCLFCDHAASHTTWKPEIRGNIEI
jgi:Bacterial regulatory proteins, luxR family